ncbi:MAG: glutamyl-tRNA reductase [Planctomycetota bacterium]|jgi:glutamyl-tRNA reductase
MRILCTGLSHKTADVALREKFALDSGALHAVLEDFRRRWPEAEGFAISTCNRTEAYTARPVHGHPREDELRKWFCEFGRLSPAGAAEAIYTFVDAEAARHLFSVAAGLDSLVPGEAQIVSQLKDAYAAAVEKQVARAVLNELVQSALHVAKHVRRETDIGAGKVSVASVAVDCVVGKLGALAGKCVLNVGAGKMNELMLDRLKELGVESILVANRSASHARRLASRCGGRVAAFDSLERHIEQADVVVTSTASEAPILTRNTVAAAQRKRGGAPLLIIDIAVPRDVESSAGEVQNVFLYNIDDLESVVRSTIRTRRDQQSAAEKIIDGHVAEFLNNLNVRQVAPTIDALYSYMRKIADEELSSARNKLALHEDVKEDSEILRRALHRTIRRIMHPAAEALRQAAGTDAARAHIAAIRKLFELDEPS